MKNFSLTILLITLGLNFVKAEIPQSEKEALLAIAENLYNPSNWNDTVPFEEWSGIVISEIEGNDHVTKLSIGIQVNNSMGDINFNNQIQNLSFLEHLRFTVSGNFDFNLNFDFQSLIDLENLEEIYIRLPNTTDGDSYYLLNSNKIAEINNLKIFTIMFNNPNFSLPDNFSNLQNLNYLHYENSFNYFPNYIYGLSLLEELKVRVKFDSEFPSHINNLINLNNLKDLTIQTDTYGNFVENLPDVLYNLPSIENLNIHSSSDYIQISDNISNYNNQLKSLNLSGTFLYLPENIWNLQSLERLKLHTYSSSLYIPDQIENLVNLTSFGASSQDQVFVPETIRNMTNLESLFLCPFEFSEFPSDIYYTPSVKTFVTTVFEEIPESIINFPSIEHIQIFSMNGLLNSFPDFLGNMSNLKKIDLLNGYDGSVNNNLYTIPYNYFNSENLEQFWTVLKIDDNVTNRFLNSPNLKLLAFESFGTQNLRGILNLCNNPKLEVLSIYDSDIQKIDLRNNQTFTNGDLKYLRFDNNSITNFYVDDVDMFNNLIDLNKVRITNNSGNFEVSTSLQDCPRSMSTEEYTKEKLSIYPNPTKDFINIEKGKLISDVTVTSVDGKILEVFFSNGKVNVSHLAKGVYILKYQADGVYHFNKFIKN